MIRSDAVVHEDERLGRIAYVDPSKQWGYLHGPRGERVYFHTAGVLDSIAELKAGAAVSYRITEGGDPLCAVQLTHYPHAPRDR